MTPEKILEIARRFTTPAPDCQILFGEDGNPTGETLNLMMWNFCEEELLAFAQSVIEADRESSGTTKQLAAYKTLVDSLEKQNATYRKRLKELEGAEAALDSERECNARLTNELEVQESSDEPVGYLYDIDMYGDHEPLRDCIDSEIDPNIPKIRLKNIRPLYTRPAPARKPLSDEEVEKEFDRRCELDCCPDFSEAVRWAEKMHGIGEENAL